MEPVVNRLGRQLPSRVLRKISPQTTRDLIGGPSLHEMLRHVKTRLRVAEFGLPSTSLTSLVSQLLCVFRSIAEGARITLQLSINRTTMTVQEHRDLRLR